MAASALLTGALAVPASSAGTPASATATGAGTSTTSSTAGPTASPAADTAKLPDGWTLDAGTRRLLWTPTQRLRPRDARVQVVLDGQPLPTHVQRGGLGVVVQLSAAQVTRLRQLAVSPAAGEAASALRVTAAGRRLDAATSTGTGTATASPARAGRTTKKTTRKTSTRTTSTPTPTAPSRVLTGADDPATAGPYATRSGEYELDDLRLSALPQPVEMRALVVGPVITDPWQAATRRPVAMFLHGRHESCYSTSTTAADDSSAWPCPSGWQPVPSYRGYLAYQQRLASQGWITISVSANGINGQDADLDDGGADVRSQLVRAHLAQWARWTASDAAWASAPTVVRSGPRPDLDRVLLVGHSRGGEGVNRVALDSAVPLDGVAVPWRIRGLVLIAPTAFGRDPAPGVPVVVLLPACDGDVSDLQGQSYLDDARDVGGDPALRTALLVPGANHNDFNTEWTPGLSAAPSDDDADSGGQATICSPGRSTRLPAATQLQVGVTYTAAAARALVGQDPTAMTLLDGSGTAAASTASVGVTSQTLGGGRAPLLIPTSSVPATAGLSLRACRVSTTDETDDSPCRRFDDVGIAPSFWRADVRGQPSRNAVRIGWTAAGTTGDLPLTSTSAGQAAAVAVRAVVPSGAPTLRLDAALVDSSGRSLALGRLAFTGVPRLGSASWSMPDKDVTVESRLPLDRTAAAAAGLDLGHLSALRLTAVSSVGRLWLLDAWAAPSAASSGSAGTAFVLPRLDVQPLRVTEGSAAHDVELPVAVHGRVGSGARAWFLVRDVDQMPSLVGPVDVPAGATSLTVKVPVAGNTLDDLDERDSTVQVAAISGVAVASWASRVTILDDDASPAVLISALAATATEKDSLSWTFTLAGPTAAQLAIPLTFVAPSTPDLELTVSDLDAKWAKKAGLDTKRDVPLSQSGLTLTVNLSADQPTVTVSIKLQADSLTEPPELVAIRVDRDTAAVQPGPDGVWVRGLPDGALLTGTVRDIGGVKPGG